MELIVSYITDSLKTLNLMKLNQDQLILNQYSLQVVWDQINKDSTVKE
jgi:hypothetical protein